MTRTGRPKLPRRQVKEVTISLRVTLAEQRVLGRAAKAAGIDFAKWARQALLTAAKGLP